MNAPHSEKKRVKLTSGTSYTSKLTSLAACHPFSEQLDVVLPTSGENNALLIALRALETSYGKARCRLQDVLEHAGSFLTLEGESDLLVVSTGPNTVDDDVWCIDSRGHLTLAVCKETYERLGIVGQKLPFGKSWADRHVVDIKLQKNSETPKVRARQRDSLKAWDKRRKDGGIGKDGLWDVLFVSNGKEPAKGLDVLLHDSKLVRVECKKSEMKDVHVPVPSLASQPTLKPPMKKRKIEALDGKDTENRSHEQEDELEEWNTHITSLFEWVGMAGLGAQRLHINDRVDPYVALYEPPQPADPTMHSVTNLQWRGLLSPKFVKQVLDTVISHLQQPGSSTPPFVGITCHACTPSPVSYIPYTTDKNGGVTLQNPTGSVPKKLPRADGEDTWSLIVEKGVGAEARAEVPVFRWCLAESLGQWDTRWG